MMLIAIDKWGVDDELQGIRELAFGALPSLSRQSGGVSAD